MVSPKERRERALIESLRRISYMYDTSSETYKNKTLKLETWAGVANDCGFESGAAAKKTWQNLRDCHRDALRRHIVHAEEDAEPKWKYFEAMSYLLPYMQKNDGHPFLPMVSSNETKDNSKSPKQRLTIAKKMRAKLATKSATKPSPEVYILSPNLNAQPNGKVTKLSNDNQRRREVQCLQDNKKRKASGDEEQKVINNRASNPALHSFFMTLYETAVHFPADMQCRLKRKLFNTVLEFEEQLTTSTASRNSVGELLNAAAAENYASYDEEYDCSEQGQRAEQCLLLEIDKMAALGSDDDDQKPNIQVEVEEATIIN